MNNDHGISIRENRFHVSITEVTRDGKKMWAYSLLYGTSASKEDFVAIGFGSSIVDAAKVAEKEMKKFVKAQKKA